MKFWDFSLQLYSSAGVEKLCLQLQDDYQVDVNFALFCCWFGRFHGLVPEALWDQLLEQCQIWSQNVVQPLRQSRRWMKESPVALEQTEISTLRERIKAVELNAELVQQQLMESLSESLTENLMDGVAREGTQDYSLALADIQENFSSYLRKRANVDSEGVDLSTSSNSSSAKSPNDAEALFSKIAAIGVSC